MYGIPSVAGDIIPEEVRVMAFLKEKGLKPHFLSARASKDDYVISSDEDDIYFSRRSDKSQQTSLVKRSSVKSKPETPEDANVTNWKAIADAEIKMKKKFPGFLKYQTLGYQRPVESVGSTKATRTTTDGSSSTPRSGDTGLSPLLTAGRIRTRQTGKQAISAANGETSHFRIM